MPGTTYHWVLDLDGEARDEWSAGFYLVQPPAAPVFGGPMGPSDIPNVQL